MLTEEQGESVRLAKRLASQISCSRSEAEKYIEGGYVQVDGVLVDEPGFRVLPEQQIVLMPDAKIRDAEPVTLLYHKPPGINIENSPETIDKLLSAQNHAALDQSGIRLIKKHYKGLTLTDSLGLSSEGLVIFTQDWHISRKLVSDAAKIEQEYIITTEGEMPSDGLLQLNKGVQQNGKHFPVKVSFQSENKLRFAFKGIQRNQIVTMCERAGLKVLSMKRIRIGRVPMSALPVGQWRYLGAFEKF